MSVRTLSEVEAEIGIIVNPADGRHWYRLLGEDLGDFDCTCGHYRRTNADGSLTLVRDDTMAEVRAYADAPDELASGWRHIIEEHEDA